MTKVRKLIAAGENGTTAFRSCKNGVHTEVFETICAFLNSSGGTLLLGVNENGSVTGLSERAAAEIARGMEKAVRNPEIFSPLFYLALEEQVVDGRRILILEAPESPEVHALRGQVFVRRGLQNIRLQGREELARLYSGKQGVYTERKIYPFLKETDLEKELLNQARRFAEKEDADHPWREMDDREMLANMNLLGVDYENGDRGLRFLAALLFGKDSTIRNIFGNTEIFCEKQTGGRNMRLHLETNLLEEAAQIASFLADVLTEEEAIAAAAFLLTEREYTGAVPAWIQATEKGVEICFAGTAGRYGNPLLKKLLREMGLYRESLAAGMSVQNKDGICTLKIMNMTKKKRAEAKEQAVQQTLPFVAEAYEEPAEKRTPQERQQAILYMMHENDRVSVGAMVRSLQVTKRTVLRDIEKLKKQGLVIREGSEKSGRWILCALQGAQEEHEHDALAGKIEDPD